MLHPPGPRRGNSSGRGQGRTCDGSSSDGDGVANGTVIATTPPTGECNLCRVTQDLPPLPAGTDFNDPKPVNGSVYLKEQPQEGPPGGPFTFRNYLKPYIVVTMINAKTGKKLKGACISVVSPDILGSGMGICDGNPNGGDADQDGQKNGRITTKRLMTKDDTPMTLTWRVEGKTPGYKAKTVTLKVEPAQTGEFEKATLKFRRTG